MGAHNRTQQRHRTHLSLTPVDTALGILTCDTNSRAPVVFSTTTLRRPADFARGVLGAAALPSPSARAGGRKATWVSPRWSSSDLECGVQVRTHLFCSAAFRLTYFDVVEGCALQR